jgi:hypothetical protein
MLRYIIKEDFIRLYDVISIIILSASVNVLIWGLTQSYSHIVNLYCFYIWFVSAFCLLTYSGGCFYWLHKEVDRCIKDSAGVEESAINKVLKNKKLTSKYIRHFIFSILCFIFGMISIYYSVRLIQ